MWRLGLIAARQGKQSTRAAGEDTLMVDYRWRVRLLAIGALAAVLGSSCAGPQLSRGEARALILKSEEFGRLRTATINLYWGPDHHSPANPALKAVVAKLGWVLPPDPSDPRKQPRLAPEFASRLKQNYWIYFPTGASQWPLFSGLVFDAARRQFVAVTGVAAAEAQESAMAEFQWKWELVGVAKELAEAGWHESLPSAEEVHTGQAAFRLYDDGWRLERIVF